MVNTIFISSGIPQNLWRDVLLSDCFTKDLNMTSPVVIEENRALPIKDFPMMEI